MVSIREFCLNEAQFSKVTNALWAGLHQDLGEKPKGWEPRPDEVTDKRFRTFWGLGLLGQAIVREWLRDNGHLDDAKIRPKDKQLKNLKSRGG